MIFLLIKAVISLVIIIRSKGDYNTYSSNSTNYIFHLDHNMISYPFKYPKNIKSIEHYSKNNTSCARGNISLSKSFWKQRDQMYYKVHFDYPFDNCSDINSLFYTRESFSLSRNINRKNSLLFLSKELGAIDHLTVYYDHQENKVKFGLKRRDLSKKWNSYECKANSHWGCSFDRVCLDEICEEYYDYKYPVYIEPFSRENVAPSDFIEMIKEKYLSEAFEKGDCVYRYSYNFTSLKWIDCEKSRRTFSYFFLNKYKGLMLKRKDGSEATFSSFDDNKYWIINNIMLNEIDLFFDYENKILTFKSNISITSKEDSIFLRKQILTKELKFFINYLIIVLVIGVIVIILHIKQCNVKYRWF